MKLFISADIEGVSGVVTWSHSTEEGSKDYSIMRKRMTAEVAAASLGAIEAGVSEIVVADSHAYGTNLIHEDLPPEVRLIQGQIRPLGMMEGINESFNAAFYIGYHSMRNTQDGTLNHSYSGKSVYNIFINGSPMGELGLNAALAGAFGVPPAFISGDEALCAEAQALVPEAVTVATKRGIGMVAAESLHPQVATDRIATGAKDAMDNLKNMRPYIIDGEVLLEVDFVRTGQADVAAIMPGARRSSATRVAYKAGDFKEAYRAMETMIMLSRCFPF